MHADDLRDIQAHGLTAEEIERQLALLTAPPRYVRLERACTIGDGIRVLSAAQAAECTDAFDVAQQAGRVLKFTPASGAASRMFKSLLSARAESPALTRQYYAARATHGDAEAREVIAFMEAIHRFAFYDALKEVMARSELDADALVAAGHFDAIVEYLTTPSGLDYANRPKGLLQFHRYGSDSRTAFEEHLVEAAAYARDETGACRLHFTVSPQHVAGFERCLAEVRPLYETRFAATFAVDFSTQHPRTDTIAVDAENQPFRDAAGRLLFRPGGHGALIENLNELRADLVFIKNIDNVVPDYLKPVTLTWKRILGGCLVRTQARIFDYLARLSEPEAPGAVVDAAAAFVRDELGVALAADVAGAPDAARCAAVIACLDRPLRVCGVVRNTGEPGGGPFWVVAPDGTRSAQIVESAEIDPHSAAQRAVFDAATHFNPVDLVCGLRNWRGEAFDLQRFVDRDAVFISHKSSAGRSLKALEHPGLWNGAMAGWNTIFVEVPAETFNPVKTVNDLLRPQHQPEE